MITLNTNEVAKVSGGERCSFNIGGGGNLVPLAGGINLARVPVTVGKYM